MATIDERFAPFAKRMRREELPDIVIETFRYYYTQLVEGHTGLIPEADIDPISGLADVESLPAEMARLGAIALPHTVVIKLNGGLGTSMGLATTKSLLKVKDDLSFLDIIARQALYVGIHLVLMNSFNTREESLTELRAYPDLWNDVPLDFLQHKVPKINLQDLSPVTWPEDPTLEWCPPGHGDIYTALLTSGMLETLLDHDCRYALVSNADNLGAVIDEAILGYFVHNELPFLMEVADRTPADRKGGHLARRSDGRLILRESAQCPPEDEDAFQDIRRHRYFNTNNLWLDLRSLHETLLARDNILGLPMIRNRKTVDPRNPESPPVYQLETAMGSAISVFEHADAVRVPRSRFVPVKTTEDLLALRSDAFILTDDYRIASHPDRVAPLPVIELDPRYYRLIDDMEIRFPHGSPSLQGCRRLAVHGDYRFGRDVTLLGDVKLDHSGEGPVYIPNGAVLSDGPITG